MNDPSAVMGLGSPGLLAVRLEASAAELHVPVKNVRVAPKQFDGFQLMTIPNSLETSHDPFVMLALTKG